jgi:hypothetical protein
MNFHSCKDRYGLCEKFPVCSSGKINKGLFSVGE